MARMIRHEILKYVTARPGVVIYKNDIAEATGYDAKQVTGVMLSLARDTMTGEIAVLVPGNAWRYQPPGAVTSPTSAPVPTSRSTEKPDLGRPLTELIRNYFFARPNELVQLEELVRYTGRSAEKVKVGINNVKLNRPILRHCIQTIVSGQTWRYTPPETSIPNAVDLTRARRPVPTRSTPPPPPASTTVDRDNDDDDDNALPSSSSNGATSGRLFEEVGFVEGAIIVRDDDGALYRATPLS